MAIFRNRIEKSINNENGIAMVFVIVFGLIALQLIIATSIVIEGETLAFNTVKFNTKTENIAEAGLNAYIANLQNNSNYINTNSTVGPIAFGGGQYTVNAYLPTITEPYIKIVSQGTLQKNDDEMVNRSIEIRMIRPTFADFIFLTDDNMRFGLNAEVFSYVHSNKNIIFDGLAHNKVTASGTITGVGTFEEGYESGVPPVDFNAVLVDMNNIKNKAQASGIFLPRATGFLGYYIRLNSNGTFMVYRVSQETNTGITYSAYGLYTIPSNGLMYIDDNFWIDGSYKGRMTFVTSQNIYIKDNLVFSGTSGTSCLGLIAQNEIVLPIYSADNLQIYAALLAQSGSIHSNFQTGNLKTQLSIIGSMAYRTQGGFALVSGTTIIAGYRNRTYTYDQYLNINPPPEYPVIKNGKYKIISYRRI